MQSVSAVAPVVFWYVLTGQSAQSSTPLPFPFARYVPFGHCSELCTADMGLLGGCEVTEMKRLYLAQDEEKRRPIASEGPVV